MNVAALIELLLQAAGAAGKLSALIAKAHAEGRDTVSQEELDALAVDDDAANSGLVAAIAKAKAAGR
jgi:hypothetical protein